MILGFLVALLISSSAAYAEEIPADAEWEKGPYITAFDGRLFRFSGRPASYYSLVSTDDYQITMKFNHVGTHIEGLGLKHGEHRVIININAHDSLEVFLDGQQLKMRALEMRQQHVLDGLDANRAVSLSWDLQFPELGNTVEIVTAYMRVVVWLQHEGFLDDGSVKRAPYLNFDAQLLQPPANGYIEGIVGEGYERLVKGEKEEDDGEFHALAAEYEMASYFKVMEPLAFAGGLGGRTAHADDSQQHADSAPARRLLSERHRVSGKLKFPMHAHAQHGIRRYAKAVSREHKSRRLSDKLREGAQHMHAAHPRVKHGQRDVYSRH